MSKEFINSHYYLMSVLLIVIALGIFFLRFEKRKPAVKEFVTLAVLSAIAVAARAAFVMVPHFKPMTGIIMITGIAFGSGAGFFVGAVSGFISNFIFGQGPWTPWQMIAYGIAGAMAGILSKKKQTSKKQIFLTAVYGFLVVLLLVGPILDTCAIFTMSNVVNAKTAAAIYLSGLPVNAVHGAATFLTLLLLCRPMIEKLERMKQKYGIMDREQA